MNENLKSLDEIYTKSFFKNRYKLSWRARIVCDAICETFKPSSVIDVGCAIGDYVEEFRNRGIFSHGIEGTMNVLQFAVISPLIHDLRIPIKHLHINYLEEKKFDLCLSFEVAEHIEEEFSDIYVKNLCTLSDFILLSAAPPNQLGIGHFNCQLKNYWEAKFFRKNYARDKVFEKRFKGFLNPWRGKKELRSYYENCMVFKRIKNNEKF